MIVTYLGKNITEYRRIVLKILCCNVPCCPVCSYIMKYHSNYCRHIHIGDLVEWTNIYRFECTNCDRTHAILPDFISPRKHYSASDIELTLKDVQNGIMMDEIEDGPSISTVKRWMMEFREKVNHAAGALKSLLYTLFGKAIGEITLFKLQSFELLSRILLEFPI